MWVTIFSKAYWVIKGDMSVSLVWVVLTRCFSVFAWPWNKRYTFRCNKWCLPFSCHHTWNSDWVDVRSLSYSDETRPRVYDDNLRTASVSLRSQITSNERFIPLILRCLFSSSSFTFTKSISCPKWLRLWLEIGGGNMLGIESAQKQSLQHLKPTEYNRLTPEERWTRYNAYQFHPVLH